MLVTNLLSGPFWAFFQSLFNAIESPPGWQLNRLFIGPSFGPRIGLSFGQSVELKRSYLQTARIGPA